MIFKIIFVCIFSLIVILINKDNVYNKIIAVCAGVFCLFIIFPYINEFVKYIKTISSKVEGLDNYFKITLKIIGVSFLCEFASQLCIDSGESYLGSKIIFAGKVLVICIAAPDFLALINTVVGLINEI